MEGSRSKHFILVHGLGHGPWCWYKVVTILHSGGHRVTALDLAASGIHPAHIDEVHSFEDYLRPLLEAVSAAPAGERLVLVGHSIGGLSLTLAMERFPDKIAMAVFITSGANYGSVKKVCVVAMEDDLKDLHRYLVTLSPGTEVEEIARADHAIMCSRPRELCDLLASYHAAGDALHHGLSSAAATTSWSLRSSPVALALVRKSDSRPPDLG